MKVESAGGEKKKEPLCPDWGGSKGGRQKRGGGPLGSESDTPGVLAINS